MKTTTTMLPIALLLAGCAQFPVQDRDGSRTEYREPEALQAVLFGVSGTPRGDGECFVRYEVAYPEGIAPVELTLELETQSKQEDGNWLAIGWMEGVVEALPSADAVVRPGGGGLLHYIHMEELLLACDRMRFRVIVHGCNPGPCPPTSADDRPGLLEVQVEDRSTG